MKCSRIAFLCLMLGSAAGLLNADSLSAADSLAKIDGSTSEVRTRLQADRLLLHVDDAAKAFGWAAKVVTPGKLLVLCRGENGEICVPIRLNEVEAAATDDGLFVEGSALASVLGFTVRKTGNGVTLAAIDEARASDDVPAYHADWGPGRGFEVGQTLPDIPLYDMQGREVRFSQFLGKQCIVYAWASW